MLLLRPCVKYFLLFAGLESYLWTTLGTRRLRCWRKRTISCGAGACPTTSPSSRCASSTRLSRLLRCVYFTVQRARTSQQYRCSVISSAEENMEHIFSNTELCLLRRCASSYKACVCGGGGGVVCLSHVLVGSVAKGHVLDNVRLGVAHVTVKLTASTNQSPSLARFSHALSSSLCVGFVHLLTRRFLSGAWDQTISMWTRLHDAP